MVIVVERAVEQVTNYLLPLQQQIVQALLDLDASAKRAQDDWQRPKGGYGKTCTITQGAIIEKAAVNFSCVTGEQLPAAALDAMKLPGGLFQAVGISLIIHPNNPFVPTTHMNLRFFMTQTTGGETIWWFGGGYDLTPYYGFEQDCIHWHRVAKSVCEPFDNTLYTELKTACDQYFFLPHRGETRGIGGLFFDHFNRWEKGRCFDFVQAVGESFLTAYLPIVEKRSDHPFGQREKAFQRYRRGRYVEFNLIYDRGTLFGLQFGGRVESILCSMPPQVTWQYQWQPEPGSPEEALYTKFLPVREWI